jgi:hypothetical protein
LKNNILEEEIVHVKLSHKDKRASEKERENLFTLESVQTEYYHLY